MTKFSSVVLVLVASCGGPGKPSPEAAAGAEALRKETESSCAADTKPSVASTGSCVLKSAAGEYCIDFTGLQDVATSSSNCTAKLNGAWATTPCKEAGIVSRCLVQCGKPGEGISTYYYGTKPELAAKCEQSRGTLLQ